jgi:hypothetical protein
MVLRIQEDGALSCELSADHNFILVRLPVRVSDGGAQTVQALSRYRIGSFLGRETAVPLTEGLKTTLGFRIPQDLFRSQERLILEVARKTGKTGEIVLWRRRYDISRPGGIPALSADLDSSVEIS